MSRYKLMDWTFLRDPIFWTAVGSVGTVLAFIAAFVQINMERSARKQVENEEQARRISAWVGADVDSDGERMEAVILNALSEPVFELIAWLVMNLKVLDRREARMTTVGTPLGTAPWE